MQPNTVAPHLADGELLHLVDRDASAWEMDRWSRHVLECEACAARLSALQRDAGRVAVALAEVRLPAGFPGAQQAMQAARARRARRAAVGWSAPGQAWLRRAAVLLVLLLPLALVSPLRAWVADWVGRGWVQVAGLLQGDAGPAAAPPAAAPAPESGSVLRFTPASGRLEITLDERQQAGSLELAPADGAEASLELEPAGEEVPVLTESGVRIRNGRASTATYRVTLPAGVESVRLRIADEPARLLAPADWTPGRSIDLSPRGS